MEGGISEHSASMDQPEQKSQAGCTRVRPEQKSCVLLGRLQQSNARGCSAHQHLLMVLPTLLHTRAAQEPPAASSVCHPLPCASLGQVDSQNPTHIRGTPRRCSAKSTVLRKLRGRHVKPRRWFGGVPLLSVLICPARVRSCLLPFSFVSLSPQCIVTVPRAEQLFSVVCTVCGEEPCSLAFFSVQFPCLVSE